MSCAHSTGITSTLLIKKHNVIRPLVPLLGPQTFQVEVSQYLHYLGIKTPHEIMKEVSSIKLICTLIYINIAMTITRSGSLDFKTLSSTI